MIFWNSLSETIQAAAIGGGATLLAAALGFGAIAWQISSQGKQSRDAVKKAEKQKLHSEAYDKAVKACAELSEAASHFQVYLVRMNQDISLAATLAAQGMNFRLPQGRNHELLEGHQRLSDAVYEFIIHVENWRIIDPRLIVFRTAMNAASFDLRETLMRTFPSHLMGALPVELQNGQMAPYEPPSVDEAAVIRIILNSMGDAVTDIVAYKEDYLVELQNVLLGDIFGHSVAHREPPDPNSKVICVAEANRLEAWFLNHTAWGLHVQDVEGRALEKFQAALPLQ